MRSFLLRCEFKTRLPLTAAFAVFEDPHNLTRITPPWMDFRIESPEPVTMRRGAKIDYRMRWLGLQVKWKSWITEYEPPHRFVDLQLEGPYLFWRHLHSFVQDKDGTVVADEVRYVLPYGPIGWLAHSALVGDQLIEIFQYRQTALRKMLGDVTEVRYPVISHAHPLRKADLARFRTLD